MAASIKIPAVFTAVDKFSHVVGKMINSTKGFASSGAAAIKRFDHRVSNSFNNLSRFSQLAIGVGIGALFLNAVDDIKTYETNLVGVGKTTGMTGKELKQLGQDTITASKGMRGISTNKLLEFGVVAGQLGITGSKNILNFSTTMAKLEKSTDIVGEEGASQIAKLLNITGEGVKDVDKFGAALVALGNTSSATESEILGVASEVARSTAAYGLNSKQILGMSATMASMGVAPEAAGTAIGKTFMGIEKATLSGGKKLEQYSKVMGLSAAETKSLFDNDKQAAFNKLIGGLSKIDGEGGSVTKTMEELGLSGTIINKGIIPLVKNFGQLEGKLKLSNDEAERNQALNEEFGSATNTVQTALDNISKSFANMLIKTTTAGEGLGYVKDVLFFVADNMDTVVTVAGVLLGGFIALKVVVGIIEGIEIVTKLWTAAQWLLNIAMDANPIGLVIIAIAALVGLIVWAIEKYNEWGAALLYVLGPLGWIVNIIMSFKKHWDSIVDAFSNGGLLAGLQRIGEVLMDGLLYPMEQFLKLMSSIPGIGKFAKTGLEFISNLREKHNLKVDGEFAEDSPKEPIDSPQINQAKLTQETVQRNTVAIDINDPGNNVSGASNKGPMEIPINLTKTQGAW